MLNKTPDSTFTQRTQRSLQPKAETQQQQQNSSQRGRGREFTALRFKAGRLGYWWDDNIDFGPLPTLGGRQSNQCVYVNKL